MIRNKIIVWYNRNFNLLKTVHQYDERVECSNIDAATAMIIPFLILVSIVVNVFR